MLVEVSEINRRLHDILPHDFPMRLIDRVIDVTPGETILAKKNTTINEPFYPGHFPNYPIMPGVLVLEAAAQAAGIMMKLSLTDAKNEDLFVFAGADQVRFKKQITPGDSLFIKIIKISQKSQFMKADAKAYLDESLTELCFSASITLAWIQR